MTEFYRFVNRRMFGVSAERSLISAIMPPGLAHINPVLSTTFKENRYLVLFNAFCCSLPADFYLKTTGRTDVYESMLRMLPLIEYEQRIVLRGISLNCNPVLAAAADYTVAEVNEIVDVGGLDPQRVGTPGVFVHAVFQGNTLAEQEKVLEDLWVRTGRLQSV
ncbi:MAG: hypothetical protein EOM52_12295 [Clostridia bacterium]|nr:hypothetical protein [Clostridia bacterium]